MLPIAEGARIAITSSMNMSYPQKMKTKYKRMVRSEMSRTFWLRQGVLFFQVKASGFRDFDWFPVFFVCCVQNGTHH